MLTVSDLERLDLRVGLCCGDDLIHNGGWYNSKGEKLGWGDLSLAKIRTIISNLNKGEVFVVLPETASYWDFIEYKDSKMYLKAEENNPGQEYISSNCSYIFTKDGIFFRPKYGNMPPGKTSFPHYKSNSYYEVTVLTTDQAEELIKNGV